VITADFVASNLRVAVSDPEIANAFDNTIAVDAIDFVSTNLSDPSYLSVKFSNSDPVNVSDGYDGFDMNTPAVTANITETSNLPVSLNPSEIASFIDPSTVSEGIR
jgi:hypothetical protein